MFHEARILVVDDDDITREFMEEILADAFQVSSVQSGESCLDWLKTNRADLILLDVKMRGMDGYDTCQQLKSAYPDAPPVIFISAGDAVEDRLRGYDAGGDDYLMKPIEPRELLAKVSSSLLVVDRRQRLSQQAAYASSTAMTAMTSMGEMGVLLQSLQRFNSCATLQQLAEAGAAGLSEYGLEGVVRVRTPGETTTGSTRGKPTPLELSAVEQIAGMGRILEFRSRMSISYEHVTLLVNNCPTDDEGRRGRLRDHLAVLAEGVEGRALAIHRDMVIARVVAKASSALGDLDMAQRTTRAGACSAIQEMTDALEKAYVSVALTEGQEDHMAAIVRRGVDRIIGFISADFDLQQHLTGLIDELQQASSVQGKSAA